MTVTFTLNSMYLGTEAGPFNISGTTNSNVTTELTTNLSLVDLTAGYTISGIDDNTTGFTIQSVGTCINYIIKPTNNCSCPGGYTASADGSICYKVTTTSPTVNGSLQPEAGADNAAYGQWGVKIYNIGDYNSVGNSISGGLAFSGFTALFDGSSTTSVESFYAGRMNANNLWVAGNDSWPDPNYPDFISFCSTFTLSQSKTYYIGIAGDNDVTIKLNGVEIVNQADNEPPSNFKFWHVYPVTLNAGPNIIELENWNRSLVGSFAAEIYDNTLNELTAATSTGMLNVVFATGDYLPGGSKYGEGFCSNYTCPSGYVLDTSNPSSPVCKLIETTNCQSGQLREYTIRNVEHYLSSDSCNETGYSTSTLYVLGDGFGVGTIMYYDQELTTPYMNANEGYWSQVTSVSTGIKYSVSTNLTNGEIVNMVECNPAPTPTPTATGGYNNNVSAKFGSNRTIACGVLNTNYVDVYFSAIAWESIAYADVLYTDGSLTTPVSDGHYYNENANAGFEVIRVSGGQVTFISDCNGGQN